MKDTLGLRYELFPKDDYSDSFVQFESLTSSRGEIDANIRDLQPKEIGWGVQRNRERKTSAT